MLLLCLAVAPAVAAPAPKARRAAVLELRSKLSAGEQSAIDSTYLTDLVRAALLKAVPGLEVMTRENVLVLLQAQGKTLEECESDCEVETARRLGADLVVSGELLRFGGAYKVSLRMHDVSSGLLLSAAQAGGAAAEELASGIPAALRELAMPLNAQPAAPPVGPVVPAVPWWKQYWQRNAAQVYGGYGQDIVAVGAYAGLRVFGAEFVVIGRSSFDEVVGGETHHLDFSGFAVGVSPFSVGTATYGEPAAIELTWLEPYVRYLFGTVHKSSNGSSISPDLSGPQFGTRLYLTIRLSGGFGLRLGGELAYSTLDYSNLLVPTSTAHFGGPALTLAGFAGVGWTMGATP